MKVILVREKDVSALDIKYGKQKYLSINQYKNIAQKICQICFIELFFKFLFKSLFYKQKSKYKTVRNNYFKKFKHKIINNLISFLAHKTKD